MIKVIGAQTSSKRISFESSKGGKSTAYYDANGYIHTKSSNREEETRRGKQGPILKAVSVILDLFDKMAWLSFIGLIAFADWRSIFDPPYKGFGAHSLWLFFFGVLTLMAIFTIRRNGKENLKNRGAACMVLEAYNDLKRLPTKYEAKNYPPSFRDTCIMSSITLCTLLTLSMILADVTGIYIPVIILIPLAIISTMKFPISILERILQKLTTLEPEDRNLELAIVALRALIIQR